MSAFKTYLRHYASFLILLILLVALFNIVVDPYGLFKIVNLKGVNERKTRQLSNKYNWIRATLHVIRSNKYDTLFLGSSRVREGLNPDYIRFFSEGYNAAFSRADFLDFSMFKEAIEESNVKIIVWGIDYGSVCFPLKVPSYPPNISDKLTMEDFLAGTTLYDSFVTIVDNLSGRQKSKIIQENGFLLLRKSDQNYDQIFKKKLYLQRQTWSNAISLKDSGLSARESELEFLEWLIQTCIRKKIDLYLFVSPVHAELLDIMLTEGGVERYESWLRVLAQTVAAGQVKADAMQAGTVSLWDFSGYNSITTEPLPNTDNKAMTWYFDPSHYRETVGDMILSRMFEAQSAVTFIPEDFGVALNPDNIEKHLSLAYKKSYLIRQSSTSK